MVHYKVNVLRDQLLTGVYKNTYDEAVKELKKQVAAYRSLYTNPRIICDTASRFELTSSRGDMCIWIEKEDSSVFEAALERDMQRFFGF